MLSINDIKTFIEQDRASDLKRDANVGLRYYNAQHDIMKYRLFYIDADGQVREDTTKSNIKIAHPFFTELVDQEVQYMLSGTERFIRSDDPELQAMLDEYFNNNESFLAEFYDTLTGCVSKGFEYMYAYKGADGKIAFQCADSMGVVEVRAKETDDDTNYVIYWYIDRIGKDRKQIKRIQVWDAQQVYFYVQEGEGKIILDDSEEINPRPHIIYKKDNDADTYYDGFGFIPFFRIDNNKKQQSGLHPVKDLIDDYDLMSCGLSNNIQDTNEALYVVKGFQGDNLDELMQNIKTKKHIGVDENGDVEIRTVDIPYQAREAKLNLDEKNIYRFGQGLNMAGLKDTTATTNLAIKAAYSLLDLKSNKLEIRIRQLLRKLLKIVLAEINADKGTDYQQKDVYFDFSREIPTNAQENAQIQLSEAQRRQVEINTILNIASTLDDETRMKLICEQLDIDYNDIKDKLPEQEDDTFQTQQMLESIVPDGEGA